MMNLVVSVVLSTCLMAPVPGLKPQEALKPLNGIVGPWKATGFPEGTREERNKGFWIEKHSVGWKILPEDVAVIVDIEKGKYFAKIELRYDSSKQQYLGKVLTVDKKELLFIGMLDKGERGDIILTLDREDAGETQRIVFTLLHANRFLYSYATRPANAKTFTRKYQVGATKEGEPFAEADKGPECIVSGGRGTIAVLHKGKTYYVCCSGCKDAFNEEPEKYIAEFEKKRAAKK